MRRRTSLLSVNNLRNLAKISARDDRHKFVANPRTMMALEFVGNGVLIKALRYASV